MKPIHALSSGTPPAGVAVIRLSGDGAADIARRLVGGALPPARMAALRTLFHPSTGRPIDRALVLHFPAPHSFTGEDVVELQCHGSIAVVRGVQDALAALGSRPAVAGEFTRRAFQNGRIDLVEAEALADLIDAETELQRSMALENIGGGLRKRAAIWREELILLLAEVEAGLDFADEGDVAEQLRGLGDRLAMLDRAIRDALSGAALAERIKSGVTIAIIGPPNTGKSSLMNALSGREVAIVTPYSGTTRDIIEVHLALAGRAVVLLDTAGLRETDDPIEQEGIRRARKRAAEADFRLDLGPGGNVRNKIDQSGEEPGYRHGVFHLSAMTNAGIPELIAVLQRWVEEKVPAGESPLVTTSRQQELLRLTAACIAEAGQQQSEVLLAESLRQALHALDRLSGRVNPEAVLDAIFGRFCIGK